jgi:succinate dehydrogenase / fumarate reductase flavoprotein subunit
MLDLALAITKGALERNEFRGAHYKPEYPFRDDVHYLKTTIASYHESGPKISYEDVDTRHLKPILRDYSNLTKVEPKLENIPQNLPLPL